MLQSNGEPPPPPFYLHLIKTWEASCDSEGMDKDILFLIKRDFLKRIQHTTDTDIDIWENDL